MPPRASPSEPRRLTTASRMWRPAAEMSALGFSILRRSTPSISERTCNSKSTAWRGTLHAGTARQRAHETRQAAHTHLNLIQPSTVSSVSAAAGAAPRRPPALGLLAPRSELSAPPKSMSA
jgi:hypothetical protein